MTAKDGERGQNSLLTATHGPFGHVADPKRTRWNDYLPVYEAARRRFLSQGEPGKLQKAGVRPSAERRTLNTWSCAGHRSGRRARKAVVSLRSKAFIDTVENITTERTS